MRVCSYKRSDMTEGDRLRPYIQPYMKSTRTSELHRVNIVNESYGTLWECSQVLHPTPGSTPERHTTAVQFTGVHILINTIAIQPILFKPDLYMVKYCLPVRVNTVYHGLVRSYMTYDSRRCRNYLLVNHDIKNYILDFVNMTIFQWL